MPSYKVAPEWEGILEQLRSLPSNISWGLERDAGQRAAAAVLSKLPCTVEFSKSTGQPRVGIQVAMPSMGEAQGSGWQRTGRLLQQRVEQHGGAAAAADWAAPLSSLCSDAVEVRPGGRSAALVFAPPQCLEVRLLQLACSSLSWAVLASFHWEAGRVSMLWWGVTGVAMCPVEGFVGSTL